MTLRVLLVGAGLGLAACAAPSGGWDSESLLERFPEVRAIPAQRLADLTPYPAIVNGRVEMVTCRFPESAQPIPVVITGEDWPSSWGASALEAVDAALPTVSLERPSEVRASPGIRIRSIPDAGGPGPAGLADTRAECDVGATEGTRPGVRGDLVHSEIRIRRRVIGTWTQERAAPAEDWIGALLHELGHALGFQGHAVVGDSLVQLEQSRLRLLGRRVLQGEFVAAPSVGALYALPPGTPLGAAALSPSARSVVASVLAEVDERSRRAGRPVAARALVGDRHARITWHWPDGSSIVLRFPHWSASLRWGREIDARRGPPVGAHSLSGPPASSPERPGSLGGRHSETWGSIARARAMRPFARFVSPAARSTRPRR